MASVNRDRPSRKTSGLNAARGLSETFLKAISLTTYREKVMETQGNVIDDKGTDQREAREILRSLCLNGFDGDNEKTGQVLGRPADEIRKMMAGESDIDDDLV